MLEGVPSPPLAERISLTTTVRRIAVECGLPVVAVTSAEPFDHLSEYLTHHVRSGRVEGLPWFTEQRAAESLDPRTIHPAPQSIISVGLPYHTPDNGIPNDGQPRGRIARYARGEDYHRVFRHRMDLFVTRLEEAIDRDIVSRRVTDTARMVDRAVAARAGLGWYGKHACIISPGHGSWLVLGEIVLDLPLVPDLPMNQDCGRCTICIDQCPTGAIVEPYGIDSRRCLSFQTIEQRGAIPRELRPKLGNWVFGCDVCQDVCPWSGAARAEADPVFAPQAMANAYPELGWLLRMSESEFRSTYSGTPVVRAKRRGLARNAAVALGNSSYSIAATMLIEAAAHHDEPLVRLHAVWALGRHHGTATRRAVEQGRRDPDASVRAETEWVLDQWPLDPPMGA